MRSDAARETGALGALRPSPRGGSRPDAAGETGAPGALRPSLRSGSQAAGATGALCVLRPSSTGSSQLHVWDSLVMNNLVAAAMTAHK